MRYQSIIRSRVWVLVFCASTACAHSSGEAMSGQSPVAAQQSPESQALVVPPEKLSYKFSGDDSASPACGMLREIADNPPSDFVRIYPKSQATRSPFPELGAVFIDPAVFLRISETLATEKLPRRLITSPESRGILFDTSMARRSYLSNGELSAAHSPFDRTDMWTREDFIVRGEVQPSYYTYTTTDDSYRLYQRVSETDWQGIYSSAENPWTYLQNTPVLSRVHVTYDQTRLQAASVMNVVGVFRSDDGKIDLLILGKPSNDVVSSLRVKSLDLAIAPDEEPYTEKTGFGTDRQIAGPLRPGEACSITIRPKKRSDEREQQP